MNFGRVSIAVAAGALLVVFQNFSLPDFPSLNVDTRTVQKLGGVYQTTTPLVPANDFSRDGRIALMRNFANGTKIPFFAMRPERVVGHLKDPRNSRVGANLVSTAAGEVFNVNLAPSIQKAFPNVLANYKPTRAILCEKTEKYQNPTVCETSKDCYVITVVQRFEHSTHSNSTPNQRMTAIDVRVTVVNPKTANARIEKILPIDGTAKVSTIYPYVKVAEPVIAGDNRLLVTRLANASLSLTTRDASGNYKQVRGINIVYSAYPKSSGGVESEQCDPSQWKLFHPISHAHHDQKNKMRETYKFARYQFSDSLGNPIPDGADLGGSYPWMDKDAANLFLTAYGLDSFYNFDSSRKLVTPFGDRSDKKPVDVEDVYNYEGNREEVAGVSMMGFWTRGKLVQFDGLINNVDYNFRIYDRPGIDVDRKLVLFDRKTTPGGLTYELAGASRELSTLPETNSNELHPFMSGNSTFLGSIENRLNFLPQIRPVTPRDIVWHFGTTRHQEELAFDDYMNVHVLIHAEMTGAVMFKTAAREKGFQHMDGFVDGQPSVINPRGLKSSMAGAPLMFQNSSTAPANYLKTPSFGIGVGSVRLEPIAKGGIHGKGAWLDGASGIAFDLPSQTNSALRADTKGQWFISAFVDPRVDANTSAATVDESPAKTLFSLPNGRSVALTRTLEAPASSAFNRILLKEGSIVLGRLNFPTGLTPKFGRWMHVALQFSKGRMPTVFVNGMRAGEIQASNVPNSAYALMDFILWNTGHQIAIGNATINQGSAIRGWVDDFKVIAGEPTLEEVCNHGRGTLIVPSTTDNNWNSLAALYPNDTHEAVMKAAGRRVGTKAVCFAALGNSITPDRRLSSFPQAHMQNLPSGAQSLRNTLTHEGAKLQFGQPRPNFTTNKFCLSCHLPTNQDANKEMNVQALVFKSGLKAEDDPRRQPMQPARFIRGIIPKDYFGPGKPSRVLNGNFNHKIDQWLLD